MEQTEGIFLVFQVRFGGVFLLIKSGEQTALPVWALRASPTPLKLEAVAWVWGNSPRPQSKLALSDPSPSYVGSRFLKRYLNTSLTLDKCRADYACKNDIGRPRPNFRS